MNNKNANMQNDFKSGIEIISPELPKITRLVIKYSGGLIKGPRQAGVVIFGFVILSVIFSLLLFNKYNHKTESPIGPDIERAGSPGEIRNQ